MIMKPCLPMLLDYLNWQWQVPLEKMHLFSKGIADNLLDHSIRNIELKKINQAMRNINFIIPDSLIISF